MSKLIGSLVVQRVYNSRLLLRISYPRGKIKSEVELMGPLHGTA